MHANIAIHFMVFLLLASFPSNDLVPRQGDRRVSRVGSMREQAVGGRASNQAPSSMGSGRARCNRDTRSGNNSRRKHLLHQVVEEVLVHGKLSVEVTYFVPPPIFGSAPVRLQGHPTFFTGASTPERKTPPP